MTNSPREFLESVVRPNIAEFGGHYSSVRRPYNAIAALDSLPAHIFVWCKRLDPSAMAGIANDSAYREELAKRSTDFRLLRDIAKALKHVELTQGTPNVSTAAQVESRPFWMGRGTLGRVSCGGEPQVVMITDSGESRSVEYIVAAALRVLEAEMSSLKL